jgi:predicted HAD superfamily Cof-like phosphohydrolase
VRRLEMDIFSKFQMEMIAKELKNMMPEYEMLVNVIAEQMMVYFNALIKAGFDEEQVFELVKEHGVNIGKLI